MNNRSARSLDAAERVRQIAVDDAKRALSDAIYVSNAARHKVETLQAQAAGADAHALALLQAPGILDPSRLTAAQRYRSWQRAQLDSARQSLAREELAEAEARAALSGCLRARDAVRNLQERRRVEEREQAARREQHALDDLAACRLCDASTTARGSQQKSHLLLSATRAMASKVTRSFPPGDRNGR
jgi:flagellar export protein FliJ